jgi:GGDEF domain-containing protein
VRAPNWHATRPSDIHRLSRVNANPPLRANQGTALLVGPAFVEHLRQQPVRGALIWVDLDGATLADRVLLPDTVERILAELVALLRSVLPADALVGRCGCDEFAAHVTDRERAPAIAEFARSIVQASWRRERAQLREAVLEEAPVNVLTLSVGVAHHEGEAVETMREAQARCNVATRMGGNRVVAHRD